MMQNRRRLVALLTQPEQIVTFPAEWDQYSGPIRQFQLRKEGLQEMVNFSIVETDLTALPPLVPEACIHPDSPIALC